MEGCGGTLCLCVCVHAAAENEIKVLAPRSPRWPPRTNNRIDEAELMSSLGRRSDSSLSLHCVVVNFCELMPDHANANANAVPVPPADSPTGLWLFETQRRPIFCVYVVRWCSFEVLFW